jgi:hypothetical protein
VNSIVRFTGMVIAPCAVLLHSRRILCILIAQSRKVLDSQLLFLDAQNRQEQQKEACESLEVADVAALLTYQRSRRGKTRRLLGGGVSGPTHTNTFHAGTKAPNVNRAKERRKSKAKVRQKNKKGNSWADGR